MTKNLKPKTKCQCFDMNNLNPQQLEAVEYNDGHLLIVAGPGTGKTHTITQKIAHLLQNQAVQPQHIVAMTFTRKAGEQLTERLKRILPGHTKMPFAGTFHSFCLQLLREHWHENLRVISQKEQQEILQTIAKEFEPGMKSSQLKELQHQLSQLKNSPSFQAKSRPENQNLQQIFNRYEQELSKLHAMDFDDILAKTFQLLQTSPQLRSKLHQQIRYLFVDEYQDVNEMQYF